MTAHQTTNKTEEKLQTQSNRSLACRQSAPDLSHAASSPYQLKTDPYSSHSVILSRLNEGRGRRLLDVGAAHGYLAEQLTQRGYEVTCIEGDPHLAALAASKCREVVVADMEGGAPELDGSFDVIVYADILEHLKHPARVFRDLNQHLTRDGTIIVSLPNIAHLWIRLQLLLGRFEYADRGILDRTHLRFFTLASCRRFLEEADLTVVELIATPVPLPLLVPEAYQGRIFAALHAINAALARARMPLFAYQFVAVARRKTTP